jgi:beta-fructofuranosidase
MRFYPVGDRPWHLQAHAAPGAQLTYTIDAWQLLPLEIKESGTDTPNRTGRAA